MAHFPRLDKRNYSNQLSIRSDVSMQQNNGKGKSNVVNGKHECSIKIPRIPQGDRPITNNSNSTNAAVGADRVGGVVDKSNVARKD